MSDFIQKKCPECGAILTIRRQPGVETMTVKCPVCHESYPFGNMKDVNAAPSAPQAQPGGNQDYGTQYPGSQKPLGGQPQTGNQFGGGNRYGGATQYPGGNGFPSPTGNSQQGGGDKTSYASGPQPSMAVGSLLLMPSGFRFSLRMGLNVIGRKSSTTSANIQINTGGSLRMSRQHIRIEVGRDQMGNIVHRCSLCKAQCNDTFINGSKLQFGDVVVLRNGMNIQLPDATLRFVIQDSDATNFSPQY